MGVALDRQGGLAGPRADRAVVVQLDLPRVAERRQLWQRFSSDLAPADLDVLAVRFRFTSGNIARAGRLAQTRAALSGRAGDGRRLRLRGRQSRQPQKLHSHQSVMQAQLRGFIDGSR